MKRRTDSRVGTTRSAAADHPKRGEVWGVVLDPTRGREQAGRRPALIVSADILNASAADIVSIVPITSRDRGIRAHVAVEPPEGGLALRSWIMCGQVRTIARERLLGRIGAVAPRTLAMVSDRVRVLLDL
ncbi:MAG: type II toxin-antitoxin system PemK/MazF family toxin [Deltaproteobacteria bacterium]|nr:type II toxin-antitoxin system PemK/MazF family toxin [Deltaproteobacteria bacterium]